MNVVWYSQPMCYNSSRDRAADLHAVGSGFNSLSDFFVSEWKLLPIFIRVRVRAAYLSSVIVIGVKSTCNVDNTSSYRTIAADIDLVLD